MLRYALPSDNVYKPNAVQTQYVGQRMILENRRNKGKLLEIMGKIEIKPARKKTAQLTFRTHPELVDAIEEIAKFAGADKTDTIEQLLEHAIKQWDEDHPGARKKK